MERRGLFNLERGLFLIMREITLEVYRHSASHILAQAVKRLFPKVKLGIGPATAEGFYYDFDAPRPFTPEDLAAIEEEMKKIIAADIPFFRKEVSQKEAEAEFQRRGESYKLELLADIPPGEPITLYQQAEFTDLCRGPHVPSTGCIRAFKLLSVAGAYWRGDEHQKMLQRIYGTAFFTPEELESYLHRLEEAKQRDHRKLGAQLDLFSLQEEGPGFPFFHPKGMILRQVLEDFWREEHRRAGYLEIKTPLLLSRALWEQSGHWDHYRENMYFTQIDHQDYAIKPMNCPGAILVYRTRQHSYREFPLRLAELGLVHRHELSGVLHGLMRVRSFTQDDAHIFLLPEQIAAEVGNIIALTDYFYQTFGFSYSVELSTRPEKALGSTEIWEVATRALTEALEVKGLFYRINPGEGAFYGPKIDFHLEDSLGRKWQCGTIQLDFLLPEKFDLFYIGPDGQKHRPAMLHRVIFGSLERFLAILTEHYGGAFPLWLAPIQVKVLPLADRHRPYALEIKEDLARAGIRAEADLRSEKISYKIREAEVEKVPYMLVVGDQEVKSASVAVRERRRGDLGKMDLATFQAKALSEIGRKY